MYLNISCISLVCNRIYWYVPCMYSYVIRMSLVYVLVCYPYVTRISLVFTRMSSVCHSYVLVCHLYVTCLLFNHKPCITTKTTDSNRTIYFLSLIFYLINKLKSQLLFKVKKIFSPILRRKKNCCRKSGRNSIPLPIHPPPPPSVYDPEAGEIIYMNNKISRNTTPQTYKLRLITHQQLQ